MTDSICSNLQEWDQSLPKSPDGHLRPDTRHTNPAVFQKRSISQLTINDIIMEQHLKSANNKDADDRASVDIDSNLSFNLNDSLDNMFIDDNTNEVIDEINGDTDEINDDNILIDINKLEMKSIPIKAKPPKNSLLSRLKRTKKIKHVKIIKDTKSTDDEFIEWEKKVMVELDNNIQNIYLTIFEAIDNLSSHEYNGELPILTFDESNINQVFIDNLDILESKDLYYGAIYVIYKKDGNPYKFEVTQLNKLLNTIVKNIRDTGKNIGIKHLTKNDSKTHKYLLIKNEVMHDYVEEARTQYRTQPRTQYRTQPIAQYRTQPRTQYRTVEYYQPIVQPSYWVREKYYRWVPYYYK
jgi:hypothetical protein